MKVWGSMAAGLALCAGFALSGCQPKEEALQTPFTASTLPLSVLGAGQADELRDIFASAIEYRVTQPSDTLVILTDADGADIELARKAHNAVEQGYRVLLFGTAPFADIYPWRPGLWASEEDPSAFSPGTAIDAISDIPLWTPFAKQNQILSSVSLIRTNRVAFPLYHLEFKDVDQAAWVQHRLTSAPKDAIPSIEFFCRSQMQGQPFLLQCEDADQERYQCVIPAGERWQRVRLSPGAFTSRESNAQLTDFNQVQVWSIGYDQQTLRIPMGRQVLDISPFFPGSETAPAAGMTPAFPFAGGGHCYTGEVTQLHSLTDPAWTLNISPGPLSIPFDRSAPKTSPVFSDLIFGQRADGLTVPVATQIRYPQRSGGSWIWVGMTLKDLDKHVLVDLVEHIAKSSRPSAALTDVHPEQFAFPPLAPIKVNVRAHGFDNVPFPYRLHAQLETLTGRSLGSFTTEPFELNPSTGILETNLVLDGIAPQATSRIDYQLNVNLEHSGGGRAPLSQKIIPIKVLPDAPDVDSRLFLHPNVNVFRVGRNAIQLHGLTYTPGLIIKPGEDWLSPSVFPVKPIREDLARLRRAGINTLRVPCPSLDHPQQLRFMLQDMYRNGFLVILQLPPLTEEITQQDLTDFLTTAEIRAAPQIVALELNMDTHSQLDLKRHWRAWLTEQFGSVQAAVGLLGKSIAASPSLYEVRHPDAFRRPDLLNAFRNDVTSRALGYQIRRLRHEGVHQMITVPVTIDLFDNLHWKVPTGFDVAAVAPHVDYVTLSAAFAYGDRESVIQGTSLALLARGLSGGKPLVWSHIGCGIPLPASPRMSLHQKDIHEWSLELARLSSAAGSIGDQYSTFGELTANRGLWLSPLHSQPALKAYTQQGNLLRSQRPIPRPWKGDRFSMEVRGESLKAAWERFDQGPPDILNAGALPEVRHDAYKVNTTQTPITHLMNNPLAPLLSVNAEWGGLQTTSGRDLREPGTRIVVEGRDPITLELLNTGMPTWSASQKDRINTVWIEIQHDNLQPKYLPLPETDFGETVEIEWHPHGYGLFRLRPILWATGAFGEGLEIDVRIN